MHFNMTLPGLEGVKVTEMEEREGTLRIYLEDSQTSPYLSTMRRTNI